MPHPRALSPASRGPVAAVTALVALVTVPAVLAALAVVVTPAGRASAEPRSAGRLVATPTEAAASAPLAFTGRVPPRTRRPVRLQVRVSGGWRTLTHGVTGGRGRFDLRATAPAATGSHAYRVVAPRTADPRGGTLRRVRTPTVEVDVVKAGGPSPITPTPVVPPPRDAVRSS